MASFTQRRHQKKSTILVSKQTVEQALTEGQALAEQWFEANANDPRIDKLQDVMDHLSRILHQSPQDLKAEGVSSIEEYFDDAKKPAEAQMIKREVDMIAKWKRTAKPAVAPMAPGAPSQAVPAIASKKGSGAAFVSDRDENGEPKAPEKLEVPRVAKKKEKEAAPEPAAPIPPAPEAAAPVAPAPAPVAAPASAGGGLGPDGKFDIKTLSTEALAKAIKALTSIKEFEKDKSAQALIEEMTAELKTRPVEQEPAPAAPAAAAPVPVPAAAPVAPAPIAASAKKAEMEDPGRAQVELGGLTVASSLEEDGPVFASSEEKDAVTGIVAAAAYIVASGNGGAWFVDDGDTFEVTENGGRTPEIAEAHSKLEDNTGVEKPATTQPIKFAADMTSGKAVREAEGFGEQLKKMYLDAKSITSVNDSRPVREAVESIFRAAKQLEAAVSVLNKQQMQEAAEEEAAKIKSEQKKKSSEFGGLSFAAGE